MKNEYGLDSEYFKREFNILIKKVDNQTPDEIIRYLKCLIDVASNKKIPEEKEVLKPCPFCGGEACIEHISFFKPTISCCCCGVKMNSDLKLRDGEYKCLDNVIKKWNTRQLKEE